MRRASGGILLVVLGVSVVVAACAPTSQPARPQDESGGATAASAVQRTLVVISRGEPPNIAAKSLVAFSGTLARPKRLFNATLDFIDERETPIAYLAEAIPQLDTDTWRVFPDGRMETTYRLRPNLTWQDGTPLSAEDFVFAGRVYRTPEFGVSSSPVLAPMAGVTAPDPTTVVIHWGRAYPGAAALDLEFQALPRHLLQHAFQELDAQAFTSLPFWSFEYVGLGPYRVERWEPGAFIEGAAFDGHALGRPKIDKIRVDFVSDPNTALANLLSGEAHYISRSLLYAEEGAALERQWASSNGGTALYSPVTFRVTHIQLRPEVATPRALMDVRVRRALAHGIDTPAAFEVTTAGRGLLMFSLTPPTKDYYPAVERAISKYPYDPRSAQRLLEGGGLVKGADGFYASSRGESFGVEVATDGGAPFERDNAIFVDSLRRAGIDATSRVVPVAQLRDNQARSLLPGLSTAGGAAVFDRFISSDIPRPENRWHGQNRGGWSNSEYDRVWQAFGATLEPSERIQQIIQMERIFTEEVPAIPHFFSPAVTAHVAALEGPVASLTPDAGTDILKVWEWRWRF